MSGPTSAFLESNREKFRDGIMLFNSGEFFKAHEIWEEIWLAAAEPDKTFLQGLIQLAAAFHHSSRGNQNGGQSLAAAALTKLEKSPEAYAGLNLNALRLAVGQWLASPHNRPACVPAPAPTIRFV